MDKDAKGSDLLLLEVDRDVMRVLDRLPEMLEPRGPARGTPSPEAMGEALRDVLYLTLRYFPALARRVDACKREIAHLEARVGALEGSAA